MVTPHTTEPFDQSGSGLTPAWAVYQGDSRRVLEQFDDEVVDCMVTSPPYYWQRDYSAGELEIGKEPSIAGFVGAIVDVMTEVRRVLRPTGVAFLNIGDTFYNAKGRPHGHDPKHAARLHARKQLRAVDGPGLGLPRKSLIGIPWRVALGLQEEGWTLRSDIIWYRKTPLGEPSSKDRPWRHHEHVFLLAKSVRYHFDREALDGAEDVWEIEPERWSPARGRHYAPYPRELVERCLRTGCPQGGTVLDPFAGGGTTLEVACDLGLNSLGIELNPEFCAVIGQRLRAGDHARALDSDTPGRNNAADAA